MLTLVWDVDDVLNKFMETWLEVWWRPQHPECSLNYEDIKQNPPHQLLCVEIEEYLSSLDDFRLSGNYELMLPNLKVLDWFKTHGTSFRHFALTAVPRIAAPVSSSWTIKHFGSWIRTFHFVPSVRSQDISTSYESNKSDYIKWLDKIDIFIDDNEENVQAVKSLGIRCFLVSQPWNSGGMKISEVLESLTL